MLLKRVFFLLYLMVCVVYLKAQNPVAQQYGNLITPADLKDYLTILASDAMEGRDTGTRGQKMAAAFISFHFEEFGLSAPVKGSYYQPLELYKSVPGDIYLKAGNKKFSNYRDVVYYGSADSDGEISVPLVYLGLAREADFATIDVKDKAVLIRVEDGRLYNLPEVARAREKGARIILLWNTDSESDFKPLVRQAQTYQAGGRLSLKQPKVNSENAGSFMISPSVVEALTGHTADKLKAMAKEDPKRKALLKVKPTTIQFKTSMSVKTIKTENVLGFLEGTDKKDEVIVITAHYDHIGVLEQGTGDRINNGADDDGSGTVAVMQLGKVFAQAKKDGHGPRRSILFMTVTGEEHGLLGSDYYTKNPVFPLENTVVNLNIDMVGRRDPQHRDSAPYVYIIGSDKLSSELHKVSEKVNNTYTKLIFDYTYNDEAHPTRLYYRSDHWNFAKNNIPIIFYFDGIHEDYHKPSDEVEKIEFDLLSHRAKCIFYTAWEIANREERIVPDGDR